jgi:hypothetical protein
MNEGAAEAGIFRASAIAAVRSSIFFSDVRRGGMHERQAKRAEGRGWG